MRWLSVIFVLMGLQCEAPVDLEFPTGYEPKVVVSAEFSPDSVWAVLLHRSIPYADSVDWHEYVITDASVSIQGDDGLLERLIHTGDGIFRSAAGTQPKSDMPYMLTVTVPGLPVAMAASSARAIVAGFMAIEEVAPPSGANKGSYEVRFRVHDQPGYDRYSIQVEQLEPVCQDEKGLVRMDDTAAGAAVYRAIYFDSAFPELRDWLPLVNDPSLPNVPEDHFYHAGYFSDRLFQGATKEIELTLFAEHYEALAPHFRMVVTNWSQELWSYRESFALADPFYPDYFGDGLVMMYTNVEGGLGIFGGASNQAFRVDAAGNRWDEDTLKIGLRHLRSCDR